MGTMMLALGGPWVVAVIALVGIVAVVLVAAGLSQTKKRLEDFTHELQARGWETGHVQEPGGKERGRALAGRATPLGVVAKRPKGVTWWATRTAGGRKITLFEHEYTESTGESSHTVSHLAAMTGCPGAWPGLQVAEAGLFRWLGRMLGFRGIEVDDEEFNRRFSMKGDSPEFALLLLSPEVRAVLSRERGGPALGVGGGTLIVWRRGRAKSAAEAEKLAGFLEEVLAGIPPELDAWGA